MKSIYSTKPPPPIIIFLLSPLPGMLFSSSLFTTDAHLWVLVFEAATRTLIAQYASLFHWLGYNKRYWTQQRIRGNHGSQSIWEGENILSCMGPWDCSLGGPKQRSHRWPPHPPFTVAYQGLGVAQPGPFILLPWVNGQLGVPGIYSVMVQWHCQYEIHFNVHFLDFHYENPDTNVDIVYDWIKLDTQIQVSSRAEGVHNWSSWSSWTAGTFHHSRQSTDITLT